MPTNIFVTNWVDRVQSAVWTNWLTNARRPSNTPIGVKFTGSSQTTLTNGTISFGSTDIGSQFIILRRDTTGVQQGVLDNNDGANQAIRFLTNQRLQFTELGNFVLDGIQADSTMFDLTIISDGSRTILYTNSVPCATNSPAVIQHANPWRIMGGIGSDTAYFTGYIAELKIAVNAIWTQTQINSEHNRATNAYGYTP